MNAYVHLDAVVTVSVVALAVTAIVVAVVVFGGDPDPDPDAERTLAVARVVGGTSFASDVASTKAQSAMSRVIAAVQSGDITLPKGVTQEQALATLNTSLQRHMFISN